MRHFYMQYIHAIACMHSCTIHSGMMPCVNGLWTASHDKERIKLLCLSIAPWMDTCSVYMQMLDQVVVTDYLCIWSLDVEGDEA